MIGETLDGKYRIDKQLGAGGMGNVYLGTHLGTTRIVAVKVIAPKWASDPHFLARFQREAQACGRLRHPNIVNVTDFGIARAGRGQVAYLVMEFLDGLTLSEFQRQTPRPPLPLVADLLDQIGLALAEAHRHGIVHRDLKPDNIWLEPNGRGGYTIKVLDFGVAKMNLPESTPIPAPVLAAVAPPLPSGEMETAILPAPQESETVAMAQTPSSGSSGSAGSEADGYTMPGSLVGTPAYMSPEQAMGREIDYRSDIYSLAVVAYSLVCGRLPFTGKTSELFYYHRDGAPTPPASIQKIPADVSDAILAGLARDPADRPASAVAFARRFHNAVDAEFLAMRRSKSFLLQHLGAFAVLVILLETLLMTTIGLLTAAGRKILRVPALEMLVVSVVAAILLIFADNLLRASAALMALDEQARVRRFVAFRVFWRLLKAVPMLAKTQLRALVTTGPGWVIGDCLWPVICTVEKLKGEAALRRSRELMTGLRSAGRALAIRHFALAALAIAEMTKAFGVLWRSHVERPNVVVTATWFPVFALFAAAPLFLYDRTAAKESGPLLQIDRAPEIRITARPLSLASMIWVALGLIYLLWQPLKLFFFGD